MSHSNVRKWCKNSHVTITEKSVQQNKFLDVNDTGKTRKQLGFYLIQPNTIKETKELIKRSINNRELKMYKISKAFDFCYGHTVFSQDVVEKYSMSSECPCKRLHGHQGKVEIHIETESLDSRGFVMDFKELSFIKQLIDDNLDHRFIISKLDPNFERLVGTPYKDCKLNDVNILGVKFGERITNEQWTDSFFVVDFNPTSEELAKWIYDGISQVIEESPFDANVQQVVWSETPKTQAVYQ